MKILTFTTNILQNNTFTTNILTTNSDDKRQQELQFEKIKTKVLYDKLQEHELNLIISKVESGDKDTKKAGNSLRK